MTKKKIKLLFLFIFVFGFFFKSNISFAESIQFYFCNDENQPQTNLDIVTSPGQRNEICLYFYNPSDQDITLNTSFVEGTINNVGDDSCSLEGGNFANFIQKDRKEEITIPAKNSIIKKASLIFPVQAPGKQIGCFAYMTKQNTENAGGLNFVVRNAYFINSFVGDPNMDGSNQTIIQNLKTQKQEDKSILLSREISNNGIMDSKTNVKGVIKNIFGFTKNFEIDNIIVNVGENKPQNFSFTIPEYKLLYKISLDMDREPYAGGIDLSNLNIDQKFMEGDSISINKYYFEMPRKQTGIGLIILILAILALKKRKKN